MGRGEETGARRSQKPKPLEKMSMRQEPGKEGQGRVHQRQTAEAREGVPGCFSCREKTLPRPAWGRKGLLGLHVPNTVHD